MRDILILTGPTASRKSEICHQIAQRCNCVIINCDSKQVYSGVSVITDQPTFPRYNMEIKLYGYVSPQHSYSTGLWLEDAKKEILSAWGRNILPIVTGGSGLYINSLVNGLSAIPIVSDSVRCRVKALFSSLGNREFYKLLLQKDNKTSVIHPNNSHQLLRAFEVIEQTGVSIFTWRDSAPTPPFSHYHICVILPERERLYQKINERFVKIICSDAIEEVKHLLSLNISPQAPIMKAHGVPEIIQYLQKKAGLKETIEISQRNTRRYAKRQYTWFRNKLPDGTMFFHEPEELTSHVLSRYASKYSPSCPLVYQPKR